MAEIIEVKVQGDPEQWLAKAKKAAAEKGVALRGDAGSGTFAGKGFEGSYRLSGGTLALRIDKKPFFLPWGMVKEGLRGFFV